MSDPIAADIEGLLRQAFAPVDPPESLAALVEGRIEPGLWAQNVTDPAQSKRRSPVRAA